MNIIIATLLSSLLLLSPLTAYSEQEEGCEDAFAFGPEELDDFLQTKRWGWQITIKNDEEVETPIYAGVAKNDISKGVQVGRLHITSLDGLLTASFFMFDGSVMSQTALYVGEKKVPTAAPEQYGNSHGRLMNGDEDKYVVDLTSFSGDTVYVVAYAKICFDKELGDRLGGKCEEIDFSWKGRWASTRSYRSGNVVQYDGS